MTDISRLIKMLQHENHDKRYEACEALRVSQPPLSQDALDALAIAKHDKNSDVAEAARRALEFHTATYAPSDDEIKLPDTAPGSGQDALKTHKTVSTIYIVLTALIIVMNCGGLFFGLAVVGWQAIIEIILLPVLIVAGCIYISRYFIVNENNPKLGLGILYSAPILAWLYMVRDTW
jgi:hypothetical protein